MGWTASAPHAASPAGAGWSSADEPVVAQIDAATPGQNGPVAGDPGRQHAIEHVDATGDRLDQISRGSHPHQVAGAVAGEDRGLHGYQAVGERLWFAEAESTDPESIERQPAKFLGALPTKIVVESALHDPEAQLAGGRLALEAARRPLMSPRHGGLRQRSIRRPPDRLIEGHGDVRSEITLDSHHR